MIKTRPLKNYNSQITISEYFNSANKSANSTKERQDQQPSEKRGSEWKRKKGGTIALCYWAFNNSFFSSTILLFPQEWPLFLRYTVLFIKLFTRCIFVVWKRVLSSLWIPKDVVPFSSSLVLIHLTLGHNPQLLSRLASTSRLQRLLTPSPFACRSVPPLSASEP